MIKADPKRTKPYTKAGLKRVQCSMPGCVKVSSAEWYIHACNAKQPGRNRPICDEHDKELNDMIIAYFNLEEN